MHYYYRLWTARIFLFCGGGGGEVRFFKQRNAAAYCVIGRGKEYRGALSAGIKNPRGLWRGVRVGLSYFRDFSYGA